MLFLESELSDIEARFQKNRNSFPHLYMITPYDQTKSIFTKQHPSKHILKRIQLLASETYKFLQDAVTKWDDFPIKVISMFIKKVVHLYSSRYNHLAKYLVVTYW